MPLGIISLRPRRRLSFAIGLFNFLCLSRPSPASVCRSVGIVALFVMSNGDAIVARLNSCFLSLHDLFDFVVNSKCPNPTIVSNISTSLVLIDATLKYAKTLKQK